MKKFQPSYLHKKIEKIKVEKEVKKLDLEYCIVGHRLWRLDSGRLTSAFIDKTWLPGVQVAHCDPVYKHRDTEKRGLGLYTPCSICPAEKHRCGIHGFYIEGTDSVSEGNFLAYKYRNSTYVVGVEGYIAAWGVVYAHSDGFRAQYARPLCLVEDENSKHLSTAYGIPVLSAEEAKQFALSVGDDIPVIDRPETLARNPSKGHIGSIYKGAER